MSWNMPRSSNNTASRVEHIKQTAKINLLVVNSDEDFLIQAKTFLETIDANLSVYTVTHPEEVLPLITTGFYDIIVSDTRLPGLNGLQLLEKLRLKGVTAPFIILVDEGKESQAIESLEAGADYYIQKGLDNNVVFMEMYHLISRNIKTDQTVTA